MVAKIANVVAVAAFVCLIVGFGCAVQIASESLYAPVKYETAAHKKYRAYKQPIEKTESVEAATARYTWWLTAFTGILAIATIGLGIATLGLYFAGERQLEHARQEAISTGFNRTVQFEQISEQISTLRQSAEAAQQSADSTRDLVRTADNTARRELRAYIGIEWARISSPNWGNSFVGEVQIKNTGQTPALRVIHFITSQVFPPGAPTNLRMPAQKRGQIPIAPGMAFTLNTPIVIGFNDIGVIDKRQREIFVWGRVQYFDIFGAPQYIEFRFRNGEPIRAHNGTTMQTVGWILDAEDEGNSTS